MGKHEETALWDDSALINAFDNAMTKYKVMHSTTHQGSPVEGEKISSATNENECAPTDPVKSTPEVDNNTDVSNSAPENCMSNYIPEGAVDDLSPTQRNHRGAESFSPELYTYPSSDPPVPEVTQSFADTQAVDYSQLLGHYYELEKQRQQVLQQLQAFSWNYQTSGEGSVSDVPWNVCSCMYAHVCHPHSCSGLQGSCYQYTSHCQAAPWHPMPACTSGGQCVIKDGMHAMASPCKMDPVKLSSVAEENIVQTAMGAAERAISSMKTSVTPNVHAGDSDGKESRNIGSGTDISEVLNAWYSAGFYTGKYLVEESIRKALP